MGTTRTKRATETTSWSPRTPASTVRSIKSELIVRVDYLRGNNQGTVKIIQDQDGVNISIYANSGYESTGAGTAWTKRTTI